MQIILEGVQKAMEPFQLALSDVTTAIVVTSEECTELVEEVWGRYFPTHVVPFLKVMPLLGKVTVEIQLQMYRPDKHQDQAARSKPVSNAS